MEKAKSKTIHRADTLRRCENKSKSKPEGAEVAEVAEDTEGQRSPGVSVPVATARENYRGGRSLP
jgi:hypothetical protein